MGPRPPVPPYNGCLHCKGGRAVAEPAHPGSWTRSAAPCCLLNLCNSQMSGKRSAADSLDEMEVRGGAADEMFKNQGVRGGPRLQGLIFPWFLHTLCFCNPQNPEVRDMFLHICWSGAHKPPRTVEVRGHGAHKDPRTVEVRGHGAHKPPRIAEVRGYGAQKASTGTHV